MRWLCCERVEGGVVYVNFAQVLTMEPTTHAGEDAVILMYANGPLTICGDLFHLIDRLRTNEGA